MAPEKKFASQLTRRSIRVPSWVWSLVLLAAAAFALTMYRSAQGAPVSEAQARMVQAQESNSHYSGALAPDASVNPPAWMVQAQPSRLIVERAETSAWDLFATGPSALSASQTRQLRGYMQQFHPDLIGNLAQPTVEESIRQPSALSAVDLSPAASQARQNVLDGIRQRNAEPVSRAVNPAVNPAVSSLLDFVAKNGLHNASGAREVALDADALNYTDYLRRQGFIPDTTWNGTPIDPGVQSLIIAHSLELDEAAAPSAVMTDPTGRGMELYIAQHGLNGAVGSAELALDPFAKNLTDFLRQRTQTRYTAPAAVYAPPDRWWEFYGETVLTTRDDTRGLKFNTKITEREQQLLDQHNQ